MFASVSIAVIFIILAVASSSPNEYVEKKADEVFDKRAKELEEKFSQELKNQGSDIVDIQNTQNAAVTILKGIVFIAGIITLLRFFGMPLYRLATMIFIKKVAPKPRRIID